jgi:YD repeat-containing protein
MVAVITGNGLGLGNTSLTQLGQAQGGSPNLGQAANASYVNTATGNLVLQSNDEGLLFDGLSLNALRTYNSLGQLSSNGWSYGFSRNINGLTGTLNTAGSTITRTDDDGSSVVYTYNATLGVYVSTDQSGALDTLSWNATSSSWTWTDAADTQQETYNATGQLTALTDTSTGASYSFSYSNGQLSQIVAGDGDSLIFGYNTSNQLISLSIQEVPPGQSSPVTRQAVSYGYDSQGRLSTVTTALGSDTDSTTASYTTTYTYQGTTDLVAAVTQSDGTTVSYTYTQDAQGAYQVTGITTGTGAAAQSVTLSYGTDRTTLTDGLGNVTQYQYNAAGELTSVIAPSVNGVSPTTTYTYDANGNLLTSTDPDGAVTAYQYDANGNLLSVEDGAGNTVSYTYNANDQVTSTTTYTVPAQGEVGQSGYVAPSGAQTTYYIYNATHQLAYTVDPLGHVSENDYTTVNALSERTTTRQYLGAIYSTSANSPSSPPTLAQLQAWVASSAVQSTLSQSTRTDYTYDLRGQLSTQTQYDTVNANGNGVLTIGTVITTTTYDAQGRLLQTSAETGANRSTLQTTSYAYDGLGRLISSTDPLGHVTSYVYDDSANTIAITQASGLTTTQVRNSAGQVISSTQSFNSDSISSSSIPQASIYLTSGSAGATTTAQISYETKYITNADGTGQWVSGNFVTVTVNQNYLPISKTTYGIPLTPAQIAQLTATPTISNLQSMLTPSSGDQITVTIYGADDEQLAQVSYGTSSFTNPEGVATTVTGELVTLTPSYLYTAHYATPLTIDQVRSLETDPTVSTLQSLITSSDSDQFTIDGTGTAADGSTLGVFYGNFYNSAVGAPQLGEYIEQSWDASDGSSETTKVYATALTSAQVVSLGSSPTASQIQALITTGPSDYYNTYVNNSSGQTTAQIYYAQQGLTTIAANGTSSTLPPGYYVTINQYNSAGQSTGYTTYATALTAAQVASLGTNPTVAQVEALVTPSANDVYGLRIYNSQNEVVAVVIPEASPVAGSSQYGYFVTTGYYTSDADSSEYAGETQYATPLTGAQMASLIASPTMTKLQSLLTSSSSDQVNLTLYDQSTQMGAQVTPKVVTVTNPDGSTSTMVQEYVTITYNNASEMPVSETQYAIPVTPAQLESLGSPPTVAQVASIVTPSANDQVSLTIYDSNGNVAATVQYETNYLPNSDGTVTAVTGEFLTISEGNTTPQLYTTPLTAAQMASLGTSPTFSQVQNLLNGTSEARTTTYLYNADGEQIAAINPEGNATYTLYNADGELAYTIDADGNVVGYDYDAGGHVIQTTQYTTPLTAGQLATLGTTPTTAMLQSLLTSTASDRVTSTIYNAAGEIVATIDPDGDVTTTTYDGTGNVLSTIQYATPLTSAQRSALGSAPTLAALQGDLVGSGNNHSTLTVYDADGQPVATVDAQGYVTVTTYNAAGEAVLSTAYTTALSSSQLSSLGDAPTLAALQADIATSAQDQITRSYYDGAGRVVAQIDADGYLTTTSYDETSDTTTTTRYTTALSGSQLSALTGTETVAALVSLLGSNTANEQTIVTTNADGQVVSSTDAASGQTSRVTSYLYNSVGQQIAAIDPDGNVSYTFYNTFGDVTGTVDGTGAVTAYSYDADGNLIQTTQYANTISTAGWLSHGALTADFPSNLPVPASSAGDVTSTRILDADGNVVATLDSAGHVTTYTYDSEGDVTASTEYATPLTSSQLAALGNTPTLAALMADVTPSASDRTTLTIYDADGQATATIDPDGNVKVMSYDAFGDVVSSATYPTPLTATQILELRSSPSMSSLQLLLNPTAQTIYNAAGKPVAEISATGIVTINTYDAADNVTATTTYATALTSAQIFALGIGPSLAQVYAAVTPGANDATNLTVYNANEQVVATVSAQGQVAEYTYDAGGNVTSNTVYAETLTSTQIASLGTEPTLSALNALLTTSSTQTTYALYDSSERQIAWINASGDVTLTNYGDGYAVTTQYATALTAQALANYAANPTLATLTGGLVTSANDQTSLAFYNADQQEVASVSSSGSVTFNTFDSNGNKINSVGVATPLTAAQLTALEQSPSLALLQSDLASNQGVSTSLTIYNADEQPIATVSSNGAVIVNTYGSNGVLVASVGYAQDLTTQQIDSLGTQPSLQALQALLVSGDNDTINLYNANGKIAATVSRGGYVTTTTYDTYGNAAAAVDYDTAVSAQDVASLETDPSLSSLQSMVVPSLYDDVSINIYDANGNCLAQVNNTAITVTTYDASGQVVANTTYAAGITIAQAETLAQDPTLSAVQALVVPSAGDRTTLTVRNASEQPVATITPYFVASDIGDGQVTVNTYDAAGNVIASTTYATLLPPQDVAGLGPTPTLTQIMALVTPSSNDSTTLTVYDSDERPVASITPVTIYNASTGTDQSGGSVTLTSYNAAGAIAEKVTYATALTNAQMAQLGNTPTLGDVQAMVTPSASDHVSTLTIYNATNQALATLTPQENGSTWTYLLTVNTYNAAGLLASSIHYATALTGAQVSSVEADPTVSALISLVTPSSSDQTTLNYYDANNRLIGTLVSNPSVYDPMTGGDIAGYVATIYTYDAAGNMTAALTNYQPLTQAQVTSLGSNPTAASIENLVTTYYNYYTVSDITIYNADEQVLATVDNGTVSTTSYNASGQVSGNITYYYGLDSGQIMNLVADPTVANLATMVYSSAFDSGSLTLYSPSGSVAATLALVPSGGYDYVNFDSALLTTYDASGNVVSTTTYYSGTSGGNSPGGAQLAELSADPSLSQVLAVMGALTTSTTELNIRDASGNIVGQVYGGEVTINSYDAAGNQTSSHHYATPLTQQQVDQLIQDPTLAALQAMVKPSASDSLSVTIYGANEQLLGTASTDDGATLVDLDASGHVLATQQYSTDLSVAQIQGLINNPSATSLQLDLYAAQGDSISQTFYNAAGKPIATIASNGDVTTTTYDAAGNVTASTQYAIPLDLANGQIGTYAQLIASLTPSGNDLTTRTIYNANEQPVAEISTSGQVTVIGYNAQGEAVTTTVYATPLTTAQLDQLGNAPTIVALNALLVPTTQMIYDADGQQIATIDPEGNASYRFYNAEGELTGTVDADGDVTAYTYDANGNLTQTIQYATPISTAGWLGASDTLSSTYPGSLPVPASSSADRVTTDVYDSNGNVVAIIDPSGNVTVTTYDGFGEAISTTQYATPLTAAQMQSLGSAPTLADVQALLTTSANDRTTTAEYDNDGRQVETTDAAGYVTLTTYDADGDVVLQSQEISTGEYATTRSYYDGTGRLVAQVDADGYLTVDSYDNTTEATETRYATALTTAQVADLTGAESTAQLIALLGSNTASEQSSETFNADNQVVSSTAADGTVTSYQYDPDGQLTGTTVTPVSGQGAARSTSSTYDTRGNVTSTTDADGNTTTYVYNADDQRIEATDAMGNSTWYYYDAAGRLIYTVQGQPSLSGGQPNQVGDVTAYTYNAFGNVTSTTVYASQFALDLVDPSSATTLNPSSSSLADIAAAIAALPVSSSDPNDTTTDSYTNNGQLATVTDGDGYETAYSYDAFGDVVQAQQQLSQAGQPLTTANSTTTIYAYNADGEQIQETDAVGTSAQRSTSTTYDGLGDVLSSTDGMGNTISYQYDALGRQVSTSQVVQNQTRTTTTSYDAYGRVLSTTDALGYTTSYSYNLATHTTTVTTPDGVTMTTVKDAYGDTVSITDGNGNTTSYTYDADGNLLSTTDALGNISTDRYDADGNLIQTTNADGDVVVYRYDANGRVLSMTVDPSGLDRTTSYVYDGEGRKVSVIDPLGTVITYAYDADGNVLTQVQDAGTGSNNINLTTTYTYDGAGDLLTVTQGAGSSVATTTQYVYDALGQVTQKIVDPSGLALTTSYQYDANGNLIATTDPYGDVTYTVYNEANQAVYTIASANGAQSGDYTVTQNTYDADGNLVSTTRYGDFAENLGTPALVTAATTSGSSAVAQNLALGAAYATAGSSSGNAVNYNVYNADGQVIYQIDPVGVVTETRYNPLGQVAETLVYATPIAINSTLQQALQAGTAGAGDIQSALATAGDSDNTARVSYAYYDADGRLQYSVVLNQVDGVLSAVVSETNYDAAGNVADVIEYGEPLPLSAVGGSATTASIGQALSQLASGDVRETQYVYNTAGEQVAQIDPNGNINYTFYDADGNVVATVDPTGAVVQYVRDDLGRVIQQISYTNTVNTSGWLSNGHVTATLAQALPTADPTGDRDTVTTYDAVGRVATVTTYSQIYENEQWVEGANGTWGYAISYVPGNGDTLTYTYDNDSRVVETTDVDLSDNSPTRTTYYFYGTQQNTVSTLNADGILSVSLYDAAGQLLQTTTYATPTEAVQGSDGTWEPVIPADQSNNEVTSHYYDALGNLAGTLDADGYFTSYTYDQDGRQTSATRYADALAFTAQAPFRYVAGADYPTLASVAAQYVGESSQQSSETYDSYGDLLTSTDAHGFVTQYAYDNLGDVIQTTEAAGTSQARTTSNTYDAFGELVSSTDGVGNVTTYTYDANGNKTSVTDPLGNTTWYVYDQDNRLTFTIVGVADSSGDLNVNGQVSQTVYDTFGDVVSTTAYSDFYALGTGFAPTQSSMLSAVQTIANNGWNFDSTTTYSYDLEGNVVSKTDGDDFTTTYTYDGFNQLIVKDENGTNGVQSLYTYGNMGHLTSEIDEEYTSSSEGSSGEGGSSSEGGSSGEFSTVASGGWTPIREQSWTYDAYGNVAMYVDGDSIPTLYTHDDLNQQVTQSEFVSGQVDTTSVSYDAYGRILTSTDAMGLVTSYTYNDAADSVTEVKPGGIQSTTVYNAEGQVSSVTDAQGNVTSYTYDADGRLTQTTNPDGTTVTNQYDADGNLTRTTDADGNVTAYTYDADGHVLSKTVDPDGLDLVTTYAYDGRGLMMSQIDPDGVVTQYGFDGDNNLNWTAQDALGTSPIDTDYNYNNLGEVTSSSVSEPDDGDAGSYSNTYNYDVLGNLLSESTDTGHATEVQYTYDGDGNVTSKTDGNGNVTYYYYNQANQLTYQIAANGAVSYTAYNADGQVTSVTQYATELSPGVIAQIIGDGPWYIPGAIQTSAADRTTYSVYNSAGQLAYTIDPNGNVTQSIYNDLGQVTETLAYATPVQLSTSAITDLQSGDAAATADVQAALSAAADSSSNARITYSYYDDMGRVSCTLSSATLNGQSGYLAVQTQYDADGNVIAKIQYGDLIPASLPGDSATTASVQVYLAGVTDMHVTRTVYDAAGRAVYSINAAGDVTQTEYDGDGRVTATLSYANAIGTPVSWTQAGVAAAVQTANPSSTQVRETQNVYDDFGNLIQTIDGDGHTTSYTYDMRGLRTSVTDGNGNTTTYTYDSYGNMLTQTSPPVVVASYSSTGAYLGTTTESLVTSYEYDNDGNLISETDASNTAQARTTQYVYDAVGNLVRTTEPDPGVIDAQTGLLVSTGTTPAISITYNAFGEAIASKDANGNVAYNIYDGDGNLLYAVDGDGYVTGYTYNAYGQQTSVTRYATGIDTVGQGWSVDLPPNLAQLQSALSPSSADRTITTAYDAQGNKLSVTEPVVTYTNSDDSTAQGSPVTAYTYDAYGNVTSQSVLVQGTPGTSSAVWATTYNYYDALGNKLMSVDPMGYVTTNTYDAFGDVLSTTQWATALSTSVLGGLVAGGTMPNDPQAGVADTTGLDRVTTYTYDNAGNKTSESVLRSYVDPQGAATVGWDKTTYGYDGDNQLTTVTDNEGNTTTTAYDALGHITSVTGPQVQVLVDNWQALLEANDTLTLDSPSLYTMASEVVSYTYDAFGDKLTQTQSSTGSSLSVTTYFQYDNAGHMVAQLTPLDGSGANWTSAQAKFYTYDGNGNLTSEWYTLTGDDGSTTTVTIDNTYDRDNQQTSSVTWRAGIPSPDAATSTTYDAFGEVIDSGDGVTNNVTNTYDNAGNKITSTDPTTGELHTYGYNLAGQMVTDSVPVAAAAGTGSVETLYTLDLDGRVVGEQAPSTDAATGENTKTLSATYDAWGNLLKSVDANGNTRSSAKPRHRSVSWVPTATPPRKCRSRPLPTTSTATCSAPPMKTATSPATCTTH